MSFPSWQWHRTGIRWFLVRTLPVAPLWCDLGFVPNSRGNKAAANLSPKVNDHEKTNEASFQALGDFDCIPGWRGQPKQCPKHIIVSSILTVLIFRRNHWRTALLGSTTVGFYHWNCKAAQLDLYVSEFHRHTTIMSNIQISQANIKSLGLNRKQMSHSIKSINTKSLLTSSWIKLSWMRKLKAAEHINWTKLLTKRPNKGQIFKIK